MSNKKIKIKKLTPSWKFYFWSYFWGILTLPLLIGIFILKYTVRRRQQYTYLVSDDAITAEDQSYSQKFDLVNITDVSLRQSWTDKKFDVGSLLLKKEGAEMELLGIESPHKFKNMLLTVSANLKAARQKRPQKEPVRRQSSTQTERIDYLTGLWQQGLLSDRDFKNEKKHFE